MSNVYTDPGVIADRSASESVRPSRHGDWKLIVRNPDSNDDRETELYNIAEDPYEQYDRTKEMPERVAKLSEMMAAERKLDDSSARTDVNSPRMG